jgi:hypothetical protein
MTTVTEHEFSRLFERVLEAAVVLAEQKLGRTLPRKLLIELHGAGYPGRSMTVPAALSALYLDTDRFYRVIDVGVIRMSQDAVTVFVRASGHAPDRWENTWDPGTMGPFKVILAEVIKEEPSEPGG